MEWTVIYRLCILYIYILLCLVLFILILSVSVVDMFQGVERVLTLYSLFGNQNVALVGLLEIAVLAITVPPINDQFVGHNFHRCKDSLMMVLKECQNMYQTVYLLCSHFSASKFGVTDWIVSALQGLINTSKMWFTLFLSNSMTPSKGHTFIWFVGRIYRNIPYELSAGERTIICTEVPFLLCLVTSSTWRFDSC